jgi:hypothetical protein
MEPAGAASARAKVVDAVKQWPLWIFWAIALSLSVFVAVPAFENLIPEGPRSGVVFAMAVAWIFTGTKTVATIAHALREHKAASDSGVKFVITAIEDQCFWGVAQQPDGSFVTQISGHFLVKNRTDESLHLVKAKLIRPQIKGEVIHGGVIMQLPDRKIYGSAHVTGTFIPPQAVLPVSASIIIRGVPRQKKGVMKVRIEMAGANAEKACVIANMKCAQPGDNRAAGA